MPGQRHARKNSDPSELRKHGASLDEIYQDALAISDTLPGVSFSRAIDLSMECARRVTELLCSDKPGGPGTVTAEKALTLMGLGLDQNQVLSIISAGYKPTTWY